MTERSKSSPDHPRSPHVLLKWSAAGLLALVFVLNLGLALKEPIWSPRDEIGHYDYIDRLSDFSFPSPSDDISDYTFNLTVGGFDWIKPKGFAGTKASMGFAGKSYEAQHPPAYYMVMAVPNLILKRAGTPARVQILTLRLIQVSVFMIGCLLVIPIFGQLSALTGVRKEFGLAFALVAMSTNVSYSFSLGNDSFSLPVCNLAVYLYLRYWRGGRPIHGLLAAGAVAVSVLVKYTNGLMLLVHLLVCALMFPKRRTQKVWYYVCAALPFLLIGAHLLINALIRGPNDLLNTGTTKAYFSWWVLPIPTVRAYLSHLAMDSLNLEHLGLRLPAWPAWAILGLIAATGAVSICMWVHGKRPIAFIVLVSVLMSCLVLAAGVLLNRYRPGVHWHEFRHFYGYSLFWLLSVLGLPVLFGTRAHPGDPEPPGIGGQVHPADSGPPGIR